MLGNLGQLFLDLGDPETALAAYGALFARTDVPRLVVPALGGFAQASAFVRKDTDVVWAVAEVQRAAGTGYAPYEVTTAMLDCALSLWHLGDVEAAETLRHQARVRAERFGFHELSFRAEQLVTEMRTQPVLVPNDVRVRSVANAIHKLRPTRRPRHVVEVAPA